MRCATEHSPHQAKDIHKGVRGAAKRREDKALKSWGTKQHRGDEGFRIIRKPWILRWRDGEKDKDGLEEQRRKIKGYHLGEKYSVFETKKKM